jgi:uroporphyrinogen decarboxylase
MCAMTSAQRVFTTLSHQEPDRVPLVLTLTMHGAKELGLSIRDYFSDPANVVEGQLRMQRKYGHDALMGFFHAPLEYEAWGGEVLFKDDGPPNSGEPVLGSRQPLSSLKAPELQDSRGLLQVLSAIEGMKANVGDEIPILGVVMSPYSLPVMQLGFERYLDLLLGDRKDFWQLMEQNIPFCQGWANAQLAAGASAVIYFDPLASPTLTTHELYLETGFRVAQTTLGGIQGATVTHLASGRTLGVLEDLVATGTAAVGVSSSEDLALVKARCKGRLSVIGNLNGIAMANWTPAEAEGQVKAALAKASAGGGFILADNHGEIPWQVQEETLLAISAAVREWGQYPLDWTQAHA